MIARKSLFALAQALEGIPVLGALVGTPAARAGVRYGDIILSVNGQRTRNVADYVEAKNLRLSGMDVVIFRSGDEQLVALSYDEPARAADPAAILAELVSLRLTGEELEEERDPTRTS